MFSNAWVHQTVESMCIALMVDPQGDEEIIAAQENMKTTLEDWIPKILAAQEPDGYLQTAFTLGTHRARRRRHPAGIAALDQRWSRVRGDHEGYVAGYFIESAINHYTLTDGTDPRLYNAARSWPIAGSPTSARRRRRNGTTAIRKWSRRSCGLAAS